MGFIQKRNTAWGALQICVQHHSAHPAGREVSRELDAGLNSDTIDYHSISHRLGSTASGRDAAGEEKDE